jgi:hypothetical protein
MLLIRLVERISKMINKELNNLKVIQYLNKVLPNTHYF